MDEGKCVGAIVCKLDMHKKMVRRGYIAMLAVDSDYRRRKIGIVFCSLAEITNVCLTLPDIQSGKDSPFTRPNRISQDRKNIKLFLQWLLSTKGYQFSISFFSDTN